MWHCAMPLGSRPHGGKRRPTARRISRGGVPTCCVHRGSGLHGSPWIDRGQSHGCGGLLCRSSCSFLSEVGITVTASNQWRGRKMETDPGVNRHGQIRGWARRHGQIASSWSSQEDHLEGRHGSDGPPHRLIRRILRRGCDLVGAAAGTAVGGGGRGKATGGGGPGCSRRAAAVFWRAGLD